MIVGEAVGAPPEGPHRDWPALRLFAAAQPRLSAPAANIIPIAWRPPVFIVTYWPWETRALARPGFRNRPSNSPLLLVRRTGNRHRRHLQSQTGARQLFVQLRRARNWRYPPPAAAVSSLLANTHLPSHIPSTYEYGLDTLIVASLAPRACPSSGLARRAKKNQRIRCFQCTRPASSTTTTKAMAARPPPNLHFEPTTALQADRHEQLSNPPRLVPTLLAPAPRQGDPQQTTWKLVLPGPAGPGLHAPSRPAQVPFRWISATGP